MAFDRSAQEDRSFELDAALARTEPNYGTRELKGFLSDFNSLLSISAFAPCFENERVSYMYDTPRALSQAMSRAQLRTLEGQRHDVDPKVLALALVEFFTEEAAKAINHTSYEPDEAGARSFKARILE